MATAGRRLSQRELRQGMDDVLAVGQSADDDLVARMREPHAALWTYGRPPRIGVVAVTGDAASDLCRVTFEDPALSYRVTVDLDGARPLRLELEDRRSLGLPDARTRRLYTLARAWSRFWRETHDSAAGGSQLGDAVTTMDEALSAARKAISVAASSQGQREPGRRVRDREARHRLLVDLTQEYQQLVAQGERSPRVVLAARHGYTPAHIGRLLGDARRVGLLGPARKGVAGEAT